MKRLSIVDPKDNTKIPSKLLIYYSKKSKKRPR